MHTLPSYQADSSLAFLTMALSPQIRVTRSKADVMALSLFIALLILAIFLEIGCGTTSRSSTNSTPPSGIAVSVSPGSANVRVGDTQPFTAAANGTSNQAVIWFVNGVAGGDSTVGTIQFDGTLDRARQCAEPEHRNDPGGQCCRFQRHRLKHGYTAQSHPGP